MPTFPCTSFLFTQSHKNTRLYEAKARVQIADKDSSINLMSNLDQLPLLKEFHSKLDSQVRPWMQSVFEAVHRQGGSAHSLLDFVESSLPDGSLEMFLSNVKLVIGTRSVTTAPVLEFRSAYPRREIIVEETSSHATPVQHRIVMESFHHHTAPELLKAFLWNHGFKYEPPALPPRE